MTSAPHDHSERDHRDQGVQPGRTTETGVARWRQPVSLALLAVGVILLFTTRILGSLSGGPFDSVADVGPQPLWALSAALLLASVAVATHRR